MYIIDFLIAIMFIIFGIILHLGKGDFLIAGYNTMDKESKSKLDQNIIVKFMGNMMFLLAISSMLLGISLIVKQPIIYTIGLILYITIIVSSIAYLNIKKTNLKRGR